jgi:hypothetical protein
MQEVKGSNPFSSTMLLGGTLVSSSSLAQERSLAPWLI